MQDLLPIAHHLQIALLLRRENRFRVVVDLKGTSVPAYLPNTGRLSELLTPGVSVQLLPQRPPAKLPYRVLAVQAPAYPSRTLIWIPVDSHLPTHLLLHAWRHHLLPEWEGWTHVQPDPRLPDGRRLDLLFTDARGHPHWVEAKSVNRLDRQGVARFPDAPTARGQAHIQALLRLKERGDGAWLVFVVVRPDAQAFAPFQEVDPRFSQLLHQAQHTGVQIRAWVFPYNGRAFLSPHPIPVLLPPPKDPGPWGWEGSPLARSLDNLESTG